jgi:hypothetical protein
VRRRERGQTLVLGALSFLVLALMVTLSFNLSQGLRAKVSLQQHSDSLAYSMAVMEARALNYYAVTNRAIAASYVAMNTLHAHMTAAFLTSPFMAAGSNNFRRIEAIERTMCNENQHCQHAIEARKIAGNYSKTAKEYWEKTRDLHSHFLPALIALHGMVDGLHASQWRVHQKTREAVQDGESHDLRQLASYNSPGVSSLPGGVGRINTMEFDCAVDGLDCSGSVLSSSSKTHASVMTEIANATRPGWPARRAELLKGSIPMYLHSQFLKKLMRDIPGSSKRHRPTVHTGTAKAVQELGRIHEGGQQPGNEGFLIAAEERASMLNWWGHILPMSTSFDVNTKSRRIGPFDRCISMGNCFMKFRANPDPRRDWGQPRVYSYVTQSLRIGNPDKAPWELNASGEVTVTHGAQERAKLTLAPGEGAGFSKALVYYHRFDNGDLSEGSVAGAEEGWREPPNLFAPYWRAKLHPFSPEEAMRLLRAAGNSDAEQLVNDSPGLTL